MNSSQFSSRIASAPFQQTAAEGTFGLLRQRTADSLVVALLSPFFVLRTRYVEKILLAVVILDIPLQLGHAFFHREYDSDLGAQKGLIVSATTLALAGLYAGWLIGALTNRHLERSHRLHVNLPLAFYVAITILSMFVAQDTQLSLFEVFLLLQCCLAYFYIANTVRTRTDILFVVKLLLIGAILESGIIIFLRFVPIGAEVVGPAHIFIDSNAQGLTRVGGTIGVHNVAGAYLSVLLAFAVSVLLTNLRPIYKWMAIAVLVLGGVALIFTLSRGGWAALILALAVICYSVWHRHGLSLKGTITILSMLILLYIPFHSAISERVFGDDKGSAKSRIPLMKIALRIIEDHPILGVGTDNYTVVMYRYVTSEFRHDWLYIVHNKYLLIWAETGIFGLLAFLAFLLGILRTGWRCWKFQDPLLSPFALGIAAGVAGYMLHISVDHLRNRAPQQLVWVIAGLLVAMYSQLSARSESRDSLSSIT